MSTPPKPRSARDIVREFADSFDHPLFDCHVDAEAEVHLRERLLMASGFAAGETMKRKTERGE